MKQPTDRRARKSQSALKKALYTLLHTKKINQITVKELVEAADLNRSTFYHYYKDVPDMMEQLEQELYSEFKMIIQTYLSKEHAASYLSDDSVFFFTEICQVMQKNSRLCEIILQNNGDLSFLVKMEDLIAENIDGSLAKLLTLCEQNWHLAAFFKSGCIGVLRNWMLRDFAGEPSEIAEMIYEFGKSLLETHNKLME